MFYYLQTLLMLYIENMHTETYYVALLLVEQHFSVSFSACLVIELKTPPAFGLGLLVKWGRAWKMINMAAGASCDIRH